MSNKQIAARDLSLAARRGAGWRCPNCGRGRLFRAYLKQVDNCASCGEPLGQISADDGPAWLTILVVGHVVVAVALVMVNYVAWPVWALDVFCGTLAMAMSLTLLPSAKGIFIGIIWAS